MNEEAVKQLLQSGFEKVRPKIGEMTNLMMDCYKQGFEDCWRVLTGKGYKWEYENEND